MNKNGWNFWNPFEKIAGLPAFSIGLGGLLCSAIINYFSGWHYHGLLHFGNAPGETFLTFLYEQMVVWLIPSILFYLGGILLSSSRIRVVDVFGTVAFSLLPLVLMNLYNCIPAVRAILFLDSNLPPMEIIEQSGFYQIVFLSLVSTVFLIWALIWMFKAVKVSCNLKGWRLWVVYLVGVVGGDVICRYLISWVPNI